MKGIKNLRQGFTLLELLVVVLIIGILAGIALPQYEKTVWKARLAEVYTVTNALEKSIDSYMLTNPPPTEEIYLGPGDLDIEVFSNLRDIGNDWYCSQYVCYRVICAVGMCAWNANLFKNSNDDETMISEMAGAIGGDYGSNKWYRSCWYEGETADIGKYLCESTNWDDIGEGF